MRHDDTHSDKIAASKKVSISPDPDKIFNHFSSYIDPVILADNRLKSGERVFYGLIHSMSGMYGYCFATNETLARQLHKQPRQVRNYIASLEKHGLIVVECDRNFFRKIWTSDRYANRKKYPKLIPQAENEIQKFTMVAMDCQGGGNGLPHIYKADTKYRDKVGNKVTLPCPRKDAPTSPTSSQKSKIKEQPPDRQQKPSDRQQKLPDRQPKLSDRQQKLPDRLLELTKEEYKNALEEIGDRKKLDEKIEKAKDWLTRFPKSYKKMTFFELVMHFYREDHERSLRAKRPMEKKIESEATQVRALLEETVKLNPHAKEHIDVYRNYVILGKPQGVYQGECHQLDDPDLMEKVEELLKKLKKPYKLPKKP